jgi:hypothetical protein
LRPEARAEELPVCHGRPLYFERSQSGDQPPDLLDELFDEGQAMFGPLDPKHLLFAAMVVARGAMTVAAGAILPPVRIPRSGNHNVIRAVKMQLICRTIGA